MNVDGDGAVKPFPPFPFIMTVDVCLPILVANCFLGAFPPVDIRAVCLVRPIFDIVLKSVQKEIK